MSRRTAARRRSPRRAACRSRERGFSFLEMLVVMGMMAVLFGLSIGYLTGAGAETMLSQARSMLVETARRCQNASIGGGRKSVFILQKAETRSGDEVLQVAASVALPVLTFQFEQLDDASSNIRAKNHGAKLAPGQGKHGNAGQFKDGAYLEFDKQSRYAMTEGFELDAYVKPVADGRNLTILRGFSDNRDIYRVSLVRLGDSKAYDVKLTLRLIAPGQSLRSEEAIETVFQTQGGPVRGDGLWQRIQVSFHGMEPSIRVDGLEHYEPARGPRRRGAGLDDVAADKLRRLAAPRSGLVNLTISAPDSAFKGQLDGLQLRGVFASDEMQRTLPDALKVLSPALPIRVVYVNGVLDPDVHARDVIVTFGDTVKEDDLPMTLRLGRNGTIQAKTGTFRDAAANASRAERTPEGGK